MADNGFFNAKHTVMLNAGEPLEVTSEKQLEKIIQAEKDGITNDNELKKQFARLEKLLERNAQCRDFQAYLDSRPDILPKLANVKSLKEEIWKSFLRNRFEAYSNLVTKYRDAQKRRKKIEAIAATQRTQWEKVIEIFNERFFVPFKLIAENKTQVILGNEPVLKLGFVFDDGSEQTPVEEGTLLQALSAGEKKALYVLNIIFEVEVRKKAGIETVFVFDDIADSFDYKNKYAIIQYLHDISEDGTFRQILLTHNFDFFRTVNSRMVPYPCCLMAYKTTGGITIAKAVGIKNVFNNDWKPGFFKDEKKKIASIPFMRNLIEYTKGESDPNYQKLTSLLHWKSDSDSITVNDLDQVYNSLFGTAEKSSKGIQKVVDLIQSNAADCLTAADGVNFENKILLAIATRLLAERYMIAKINNPQFVASIDSHQTPALLRELRKSVRDEDTLKALERVVLMTPENIHLNSFMYEPILDMSDEHLRKLYQCIRNLK